jgi:hypothetical protein
MDVILVGTNSTSYSISDGTRTITLVGLPSITTENLLYVYNITQDELYYSPVENLAKASVSGGDTITISTDFAVMADTDTLHIQLTTGDFGYDESLDVYKTTVQNPEYAYRTSPELTVDYTNQAAGTYYFPIPWDTYKYGSMFVTAVTGAGNTFDYTLWATNKFDVDLVTISELEWDDVTNYLTGAASYSIAALTANYEAMHWLDTPIIAEYLMLKVVVVDGGTPSNTLGIYTKKGY